MIPLSPNAKSLSLLLPPNRRHCVWLDGKVSSELNMRSRVPQGSILGLLLFLFYVNDSFSHVLYSCLTMFADDSECSRNLSSHDCLLLQSDLDMLTKWCYSSLLSFNVKSVLCSALDLRPCLQFILSWMILSPIVHHTQIWV